MSTASVLQALESNFPEMAVFELEKLVVLLAVLHTWPNPSIALFVQEHKECDFRTGCHN